jgi:hypothetical protein
MLLGWNSVYIGVPNELNPAPGFLGQDAGLAEQHMMTQVDGIFCHGQLL